MAIFGTPGSIFTPFWEKIEQKQNKQEWQSQIETFRVNDTLVMSARGVRAAEVALWQQHRVRRHQQRGKVVTAITLPDIASRPPGEEGGRRHSAESCCVVVVLGDDDEKSS